MKRFVEGEDRYQSTLFPETLDDYVAEENPVRVIEAFIDELDLGHLGFQGVAPKATGRPAYHPSILLKIYVYVYGYLNRIQSSRRLERETQRNVELMWLTGRLAPDFKTIADFRKDNGEAIRAVCREFIVLCRQFNLFSKAIVAIDGSKFKAVNNRNRNFTRAMATSRKDSGTIGYNVQTAVDTEHHLIVTHEVTNVGHDRGQLFNMAQQARAAMDSDELTAVADRGYFKGEEIRACHEAGIETYVPKPQTSGSQAAGRFGKQDFHYLPEKDVYRCPAGNELIWRMTTEEKGQKLHRYWSSNCQSCALKQQCTPGKERRVTRWEHEAILEAAQEWLEQNREMMLTRQSTVEHPFGTIKAWMGATHFQTKTMNG